MIPALVTAEPNNHEDDTVTGAPFSDADEKVHLLRLPSPTLPDSVKHGIYRRLADMVRAAKLRTTRDAWIRAIKACLLAAKAVSVVAAWNALSMRPGLLTVLALAALADPFSERLRVSLVLGIFHVGLIWVGRRLQLVVPKYLPL
ncbi:hypothetical protein ID866_4095 [Astraeus odoratus]|nr:hypothetical protein ID866_4095 [Astraeus odoratus]